MKLITNFIFIALALFLSTNLFSQVKISTDSSNTTAHVSAALEVESSDKGLLLPRVSNYSTISSPAAGLVLFDRDAYYFKFRDGSGWITLTGGESNVPYIGATDNLNLGIFNLSADSLNANTLISTQDITVNGLRIGKGPGTNNSKNIAVGFGPLNSNTTGSSNTGIGYNALKANISGSNNVALGVESLFKNTNGSTNTGLGHGTLYNSNFVQGNTAIGGQALYYTTEINNTALGSNAGNKLTSGSRNIAIGAFTNNFPSNTSSYQLNIGNEIYGIQVNDPYNDVLIGIGNSDPNFTLDVNGTARISNVPTISEATKVLVKDPTTGLISEQSITIDNNTVYSPQIMKFRYNKSHPLNNFDTFYGGTIIQWHYSPEVTIGSAFGSMSNGIFTVYSAGKYKVTVNYKISGNPEAYATTSRTDITGTRYLQCYINDTGQHEKRGTVVDIIELPAGGPIYWRTFNTNTIYIHDGSSISIEKLE